MRAKLLYMCNRHADGLGVKKKKRGKNIVWMDKPKYN